MIHNMLEKFLISYLILLSSLTFAQQCQKEPPGVEGIPFDSPDEIKLSKVTVSNSGVEGYVATEYTGAANLQGTIYIKRNGKYCDSGDLGSLIAFESKPARTGTYYNIRTTAKSGSDKYLRVYSYKKNKYQLQSCEVINPEGIRNKCGKGDR